MAGNRARKAKERRDMPANAGFRQAREAKRMIFACGEERKPEEMNVPHESFYKVLVKAFGLENVRRWHSGDLTRYLIWIFSGTVILITILLLVWI